MDTLFIGCQIIGVGEKHLNMSVKPGVKRVIIGEKYQRLVGLGNLFLRSKHVVQENGKWLLFTE